MISRRRKQSSRCASLCPITLCSPNFPPRSYEKECLQLLKDSKTYLDAMRSEFGIFIMITILKGVLGMASTQTRLAETIDTFYSASGRTTEGAIAAHSYRRAAEELDSGINRELVRCHSYILGLKSPNCGPAGSTLSHNCS